MKSVICVYDGIELGLGRRLTIGKIYEVIELINDNIKESNENFYLEISNPNYGSFGYGVLTLTAVRTIVDDDFIA